MRPSEEMQKWRPKMRWLDRQKSDMRIYGINPEICHWQRMLGCHGEKRRHRIDGRRRKRLVTVSNQNHKSPSPFISPAVGSWNVPSGKEFARPATHQDILEVRWLVLIDINNLFRSVTKIVALIRYRNYMLRLKIACTTLSLVSGWFLDERIAMI